MNKVALVIGINKYEGGEVALTGAVNDAEAVAARLETKEFGFKVVKLLSDADGAASTADGTLKNTAPTRPAILAALGKLATDGGDANDVVVIYFAGRGGYVEVEDGSRGLCTWLAADGLPIFEDELRAAVVKINEKRTSNVVLLLDTCHLGTAAADNAGVRRVAARQITAADRDALLMGVVHAPVAAASSSDVPVAAAAPSAAAEPSFVMMAACQFDANQGAFERGGRGCFTAALLEVLSQSISYTALLDAVRERLRGASVPAVPALSGSMAHCRVFSEKLALVVDRCFKVDWTDAATKKLLGGRLHGVTVGSKWLIAAVPAVEQMPNATRKQFGCEAECVFVDDVEAHLRVVFKGAAFDKLSMNRIVMFAQCIVVADEQRGGVFVTPEAAQMALGAAILPLLRGNVFLRVLERAPAEDERAFVVQVAGDRLDRLAVVGNGEGGGAANHSLVPAFACVPDKKLARDTAEAFAHNIDKLYHYDRMLRIADPAVPWPLRSAVDVKPKVTVDTLVLDKNGKGTHTIVVTNNTSIAVSVALVLFCTDGQVEVGQVPHPRVQSGDTVECSATFSLNKTSVSTAAGTAVVKVFVAEYDDLMVDCFKQKAFLEEPTLGAHMGGGENPDVESTAQAAKWTVHDFPIKLVRDPAPQSAFAGSPVDAWLAARARPAAALADAVAFVVVENASQSTISVEVHGVKKRVVSSAQVPPGANQQLEVPAEATLSIDGKIFALLPSAHGDVSFYVFENNDLSPKELPLDSAQDDVAAPAATAAAAPAGGGQAHADKLVREKDWVGHRGVVRHMVAPCEQEREYVTARQQVCGKALKAQFRAESATLSAAELPTIAVTFSGGGMRAMIATVAMLDELAADGLLACATYVGALSGSTWAVSTWLVHEAAGAGNPLVAPDDTWVNDKASGERKKLHDIATAEAWFMPTAIGDALREPFHGGENKSMARAWGTTIARKVIASAPLRRVAEFGDAAPLLKSALTSAGPKWPYPICTAVHKAGPEAEFEWFSFTPHEVGQVGVANARHIDSRDFGRRFIVEKGKAAGPEPAEPTAPLRYLYGIWGSAFAADGSTIMADFFPTLNYLHSIIIAPFAKLVIGLSPTPLANVLSRLWARVSKDTVWNRLPAHVPSWVPGRAKDRLLLRDAGTCFNLPLPPFCAPQQRKCDVVLAFDFSASLEDQLVNGEEPSEIKKAVDFFRKQGDSLYEFPTKIERKDGNGCKRFVRGDHQPLNTPDVVYVPFKTSEVTSNFTYTTSQTDALYHKVRGTYSTYARAWVRECISDAIKDAVKKRAATRSMMSGHN